MEKSVYERKMDEKYQKSCENETFEDKIKILKIHSKWNVEISIERAQKLAQLSLQMGIFGDNNDEKEKRSRKSAYLRYLRGEFVKKET